MFAFVRRKFGEPIDAQLDSSDEPQQTIRIGIQPDVAKFVEKMLWDEELVGALRRGGQQALTSRDREALTSVAATVLQARSTDWFVERLDRAFSVRVPTSPYEDLRRPGIDERLLCLAEDFVGTFRHSILKQNKQTRAALGALRRALERVLRLRLPAHELPDHERTHLLERLPNLVAAEFPGLSKRRTYLASGLIGRALNLEREGDDLFERVRARHKAAVKSGRVPRLVVSSETEARGITFDLVNGTFVIDPPGPETSAGSDGHPHGASVKTQRRRRAPTRSRD